MPPSSPRKRSPDDPPVPLPRPSETFRSKVSARGGKPRPARSGDRTENERDDERMHLDIPRSCAVARNAIDALADLDTPSVRSLVAPTPRGLQRRRQIAMYLAHTALGVRASEVAKQFGRDTTTAYHAFRQIEDLRDDPLVDGFLDAVDAMLVSLVDPVATDERPGDPT